MKRTLAILLAVIMIISALPVMAFAAGTTISFETTFTEEMVVGDTFTVVAKLEGNPTFGTMTLDMDWNEDVLSFQGFDANARGVLTSEVFNTADGYAAPVINQEKGILTCADALGYDLNGVLFTANFEIVGSGELGLCFNEDKYEFKNLDGSADVDAAIDYSAIENLSVAGAEPEGPAIPDGAPFTAITTDAGAAIAIEQQENVSFNYADVPYYIVTIPADATTAYVTAPDQVVMEDYNTGELQATGYAAEVGNGWNPLYISYNYEDTADGPKVEIPMNMVATDWSGEVELCFVEDEDGNLSHAFGIEDSNYACLGLISFRYGTSSAPVEPEEPTVSEIPAGAAFVDMIARVNGEDKPVTITYVGDEPSSGMGPLYKVEVPLGTTSVYAVYNEGDVYVDDFGYAKTVHVGWDNVQSDGYAQSTQNGKTTVGLMMEKAAANGSGTIKLLNIPYNEEELRYVGLSDSTDTRYHFFAFTYELGEGQYFASLPSNHMYAVTGDGVASDGYTFNVYILNGYEATENFAVLVNGKIVATEPGDITIESVTEDLIITVEGVTQSYNPETDVCIILDLTEYTGPINGEMWCSNKNGQNSNITLTAGKKHTMSLAASDIWQMYCNIYSIGSNVVGYDINGETRDPGESGYLSFGFNVRDNAEPGLYVIKPILSGEAPEEPNPEEPEEPEVTFPITITVDGEPVTATYEGTEYSNMAYTDVPKFVAKVPAGTTAFTVSHPDGIMMAALANGNFLAQGETSCTVTLSGNAGYMIAEGGSGFQGHLYIEIEEGSEPEEPTTYTITAQQPTGGTVTVLDQDGNEITQAAEGDAISLNYEADEGYRFKHYLINGTVVTEDNLGMTNGFYLMPAENITVTAVFESTAEGYFFATSADVSAENGGTAVVSVKITGHSDENITGYNAYDVTLTFDETKLEYVDFDGAVKSDNGQVKVEGNTIRIVGCGADKAFGTEIARLTFKTKAEGAAQVTVSKAQVSDKEESVTEDIPEATPKHDENDTTADTTPDQSVVLVPYTVTKPGFVSGETSVLHGEDYTFSYTDTVNYTYSGLKVTVGGTEVTPTVADGVYTIANVTGAVTIEVTQTANSYTVTKPTNVTGLDKATYGEDYIFTVTPSEGKVIDTVTVTTANGSAIPYTINENGEYVIKGTDISGPFTITVTEKDKPVTTTTITFNGVEEAEVVGGLTQTAPIGKEFTFQLNKDEKFTYTAKVGETDLVETPATDEAPAFYTIPAELVVEGGVTVTITKTAVSNLKVEVSPYFNTDGAVMFLVIAKDGEKILTYGEEAMFYSDKYALTGEEAGAYCWLVSSGDDADTVKAAAVASIKAAEETVDAPVVAYDCDVNQTTKVDVNDAQLAYDMYKGVYGITESVTMDKFLEADISTDRKLDVNDVAAIINFIVNGRSN